MWTPAIQDAAGVRPWEVEGYTPGEWRALVAYHEPPSDDDLEGGG